MKDLPKKGEDVYVPTALYLSHGVDDFVGGLAQVREVTEEKHGERIVHGIQIVERPGSTYFWENGLADQQDKLKAEFGNKRSYPDPDYAPESNRWD